MLDEHGEAIEADLQRFYRIDLIDFYRGDISPRKLGVLLRHLPHDSALVRALNNGQPGWGLTDSLLADLWALTVQTHADRDKLPADFDHPARAEMVARADSERKQALRVTFQQRKSTYTSRR